MNWFDLTPPPLLVFPGFRERNGLPLIIKTDSVFRNTTHHSHGLKYSKCTTEKVIILYSRNSSKLQFFRKNTPQRCLAVKTGKFDQFVGPVHKKNL